MPINEKALSAAAQQVTNSNYMTEQTRLNKARAIIEAYEAAKAKPGEFDTFEANTDQPKCPICGGEICMHNAYLKAPATGQPDADDKSVASIVQTEDESGSNTHQPVEETDLRIDTSSVNPTVRITHRPTGIVAEGNLYKSQMMNRCYAMGVLAQRLREREYKHDDLVAIRQAEACIRDLGAGEGGWAWEQVADELSYLLDRVEEQGRRGSVQQSKKEASKADLVIKAKNSLVQDCFYKSTTHGEVQFKGWDHYMRQATAEFRSVTYSSSAWILPEQLPEFLGMTNQIEVEAAK